MRPEVSAAIAALEAHRVEIGHRRIVDLFDEDPKRFENFSARLDDLLLDYSKQRVTPETMRLLVELAQPAGILERNDVKVRAHALAQRDQGDAAWAAFTANLKTKTPVQVDESRFLPLAK